jgi:hypothetical protein
VAASDDEIESVFLRIDEGTVESRKDTRRTYLIEINADGGIPREIGLAADGHATYVTRPGEYGLWNDSPIPATPLGTPEFESQWGGYPRISREEFEGLYSQADAVLPHTLGGTPIWLSNLVALSIPLALGLFVVGVLALLWTWFT